MKPVHLIIIPGLGNNIQLHTWASSDWMRFGIIPHVFDTRWKVEERGFEEKLRRALVLVDSLPDDKPISVMGNSAGSSLALNLYAKRKNRISHVIVNCGRVRRSGDWPWFTFKQATASSPSFMESVICAEQIEKTFTQKDRKKILTLRPLFDEVVPPVAVPIKGASNKVTSLLFHSLTIALYMTLLKKQIVDFICDE